MKTYYVTVDSEFKNYLLQYLTLYHSIGIKRLVDHPDVHIFDLKKEHGEGTISVYRLLDDLVITLYDYTMYHDVVTHYEISAEYFELEYCIQGSMDIKTSQRTSTFSTNQLSMSPSSLEKGSIIRKESKSYHGVSIVMHSSVLNRLLKDKGKQAWVETMSQLSDLQRYDYYFGKKTSVEISNAFRQMFECRLPNVMKPVYLEAKTLEVIALLLSKEVMIKEQSVQTQLSEYEVRQLTSVPEYLFDHRFDLPSMKTLSETFALSELKLKEGFKRIYETTPYAYHRKNILNHGKELLLYTDLSIDYIALELGYSNASNFVSAFKKEYSMTPLKYREQSLRYEAP